MKNSDKREYRINFVDILITLVLIALISVGAMLVGNAFGVESSAGKTEASVEYTLVLRGVRNELCDKMQIGDAVAEAAKRFDLGRVTAVKVEPYYIDVYDRDADRMVHAEYPDFSTLVVTVVSDEAKMDNEMCYVNGTKIAVGQGVSFHTKNFCGTGYIGKMTVR
ncbi:MAG: DUF4330 domain-containing protein [Clostridia bacterium]|nr:DUF4330 domain-containing protein [Clostridia bacterium]